MNMTIITQSHCKVRLCSGFTLIETMIAVFILTICLLGLTGTYINVLKNTQNTYQTSVENFKNPDPPACYAPQNDGVS